MIFRPLPYGLCLQILTIIFGWGIGTYGLACLEYATGKLKSHSQMPEFTGMTIPTVFLSSRERVVEKFGLERMMVEYLLTTKDKGVRNLTPENCKFLGSSCVSALYEDKYANCWVGTRGSLGVQLADGNSFLFENMSFVDGAQLNWFYVRDIIADSDNSMWIATSNYGLIHIEGDIRNPSTLKYYNYSFL